jgi:glycerate 2-kinase
MDLYPEIYKIWLNKMESWIKNFNELATTPNRKMALQIAQAGLDAINTGSVVDSSVSVVGNILFVKGKPFNLDKYKKIKVVGFGKSSCEAALALEKILGPRISKGVVIGLSKVDTKYIETFAGTHPKPSEANVLASKKIVETIENSSEDDLIIVIVSGGGSSLLCYGENELEQGIKLYDSFLKCGQSTIELNTIRKHISVLKGGGLAKLAYPATVIGLVFSDVPGDHFENVASGPTYMDKTTISDAERIIKENNLEKIDLVETPKEDKYFDKVYNFVLVSNKTAVEAMAKKAQELDLGVNIVSTDLYDEVDKALEKIFSAKKNNSVALAAGEPNIKVKKSGGKGGRNLHMGLEAIEMKLINDDSVFISLASDGMDNSDVAGAIVDKNTIEKSEKLDLDVSDYLERFDSYTFFQKSGNMIITGPTGANVSDLMILLTKNG